MLRYVAIDPHTQTCTIAVMGPSGRHLSEQVVETNGKTLRAAVSSIAGEKHLAIEEGELSEWLYELLEPLCEETVVIQSQRRQGNKNDSLDTWELADLLRTRRRVTAIFKAPGQFTPLREAVRAHQAAVKEVVRSKNRLRALFRSRGVIVAAKEIYNPERREEAIVRLPPHRRRLARIVAAQLDALVPIAKDAEAWLLEEATAYPIVGLLATAPGIGDIRASQVVATVIRPQRFRTKRQFWSYCGLAVITTSSSDWQRAKSGGFARRRPPLPRGLNRNRHPLLKQAFKGAAISVITRSKDHPLRRNYERLVEAGTCPSSARLTIARQIAAAVLAMWKKLEAYDPERHESKSAA